MAKKINKSIDTDKTYFLYKHNIFVYPISEFEYNSRNDIFDYGCIKNKKWYIEVLNNNKIKIFEKQIKQDEINDSIFATINYYYKLLTEK